MYNVYSMTDGTIDNERSFDDYEEAVYYYADLIHRERALREVMPECAESTVHLFDTHEASMNLLAEHCIESTVQA